MPEVLRQRREKSPPAARSAPTIDRANAEREAGRDLAYWSERLAAGALVAGNMSGQVRVQHDPEEIVDVKRLNEAFDAFIIDALAREAVATFSALEHFRRAAAEEA